MRKLNEVNKSAWYDVYATDPTVCPLRCRLCFVGIRLHPYSTYCMGSFFEVRPVDL